MSKGKRNSATIPVIDIFAGAGGLGEGFSSFPERGQSLFDVRLSIEKDSVALDTLRLRSFFHLFPDGDAPPEYYSFIQSNGAKDLEIFSSRFRQDWKTASERVLNLEFGAEGFDEAQLDSAIEASVGSDQRDWVLVGGPPCQAYSHAGRSSRRAKDDYRPEEDKRHFLYEEYLRIISRHWPAVVIMENVQGILSSRVGGRKIFGNILRDLADPAGVFGDRRRTHSERYRYRLYPLAAEHGEPDLFGYSAKRPMDYVVNCEMFGVPQRRSRVILLAIRDDIAREPDNLELFPGSPATVKSVLAGLPRLRSGLTEEKDTGKAWMDVLRSALDEAWLDQIKPDRDSNVRDRILQTLDTLLMPRSGRGSEFVRKKKKHNSEMSEYLKEWLLDDRLDGFCNHRTRSHMASDLHRYLFCASFARECEKSPKLSDFPTRLLPAHRSVDDALKLGTFADRFRVQLADGPATTVTSHIARDGHYYIHFDPGQCRSLTVREVARLQTFPDNYLFCGNLGEQYTQVGNAVPPLLARQIAGVVAGVLN